MKKELVSELFSGDDDWHNNACLNEWSRDHGATYAAGYRRAAELLIEHIDTKGRDQDVLVYPVVFLYRHHVELALKRIISICLLQIDDPDVKGQRPFTILTFCGTTPENWSERLILLSRAPTTVILTPSSRN